MTFKDVVTPYTHISEASKYILYTIILTFDGICTISWSWVKMWSLNDMARFSTAQRKTARSEMTQYRDVLTRNQTRLWKIASKPKAISIRTFYTSMVNRCIAAGCGNVATVTISVFTFPFDVNLRRKWVAAVRQNRKGWDGPGTVAVLCSAHFTADAKLTTQYSQLEPCLRPPLLLRLLAALLHTVPVGMAVFDRKVHRTRHHSLHYR